MSKKTKTESPEIASLRAELAQLRQQLAQALAPQQPQPRTPGKGNALSHSPSPGIFGANTGACPGELPYTPGTPTPEERATSPGALPSRFFIGGSKQ